jgi:hypothetical protein
MVMISWLDELVSAEQVLPSWLITEIKTHLHTNGDEVIDKMIDYKLACLHSERLQEDYDRITEETHPNQTERWDAEYKVTRLQRTHERYKSVLYREMLVLLRGEDRVKQSEVELQRRWKDFDEKYQKELEWILKR